MGGVLKTSCKRSGAKVTLTLFSTPTFVQLPVGCVGHSLSASAGAAITSDPRQATPPKCYHVFWTPCVPRMINTVRRRPSLLWNENLVRCTPPPLSEGAPASAPLHPLRSCEARLRRDRRVHGVPARMTGMTAAVAEEEEVWQVKRGSSLYLSCLS